jgi:hypothetical protein
MKIEKVAVFSRFGNSVAEMPEATQVGTVDVPTYESLDEMRQALPGGDADILALANTQNGTNIRNEARRQAQVTAPSKTKLREQAESRLWDDEEVADAILAEKDPVAKKALREKFISEEIVRLTAEFEQKKNAIASGTSTPVADAAAE